MAYLDDDLIDPALLVDPSYVAQARSTALRNAPRPLALTPTHGVEAPPPQPGANPLTPTERPAATPGDYRARALANLQEAGNLEPAEPDRAAVSDFARRRQEGSKNDFIAGLALSGLGGESFAPVGGLMLQQALKNKEPFKFGGGLVADGEFLSDPEEGVKRRAARLETQAKLYEQMAHNAETTEQRRAAAEAAAQARADSLELRRTIAATRGGGEPKLERAGVTPDGRVVSYNKMGGGLVVDGRPYQGPMMSLSSLDKQTDAVQKTLTGLNQIKSIEAMMAKNPNAFGGVASIASLTPQMVSSRWLSAKLSPEEQQTRAMVLQHAAETIHQLYGAALTANEDRRAAAFAPNPSDPPEVIMTKLRAAIAWGNSKANTYGHLVRSNAEARSGGLPDGGGGLPPGVSVTERVRQ